MKVGVRYVVTTPSKYGEFEVGDSITLTDDGAIINWAANGWIEPEYLSQSVTGITVEIDLDWVKKKQAELQKELSFLATL